MRRPEKFFQILQKICRFNSETFSLRSNFEIKKVNWIWIVVDVDVVDRIESVRVVVVGGSICETFAIKNIFTSRKFQAKISFSPSFSLKFEKKKPSVWSFHWK